MCEPPAKRAPTSNPKEEVIARVTNKGKKKSQPNKPKTRPHLNRPLTQARRRIVWKTTTTYTGTYRTKNGRNQIVIHSLSPLPKKKELRVSGGTKKFHLVNQDKQTRKVIIVAKSAKKASKTKDEILDDELENLEDLEDLDDLDDLEDEEVEDEDLDDEEDEDEDEDEDDEDEDDEDESSDLEDLTVKELRARAKEDGHTAAAIKGLKKDDLIELIENGVEEDDEDEDEEEEEAPAPKKGKKGKAASKSTKKSASKGKKGSPSRSRTTDGKVGVQEVAEAAGTTPRSLRMVLRKEGIQKDPDVSRYEWSSLNHPEVKKIIKRVQNGAVKAANKESLDKLKKSKKGEKGNKKGGAKRSKKKG